MTETASETSTDVASKDAEVAAALFGDEVEEQGDEQEGSADQESEENEVVAELARLKVELATLRRENAERRVRDKEKAKAASSAPDPTDVDAARKAGFEEARQEYGIRLASAEVRTALTGVVPEDRLTEVVEDLNLARYVGDDGEPDVEAIKTLREKYQALIGPARKTAAKISHGRQGSGTGRKSNADQFAELLSQKGLLG